MSPWRPWPYAAKAIVQHTWSPNTLRCYITFRHPMDQTVLPANAKWIIDQAIWPIAASSSSWLDAYTLLLELDFTFVLPPYVTVKYLGPDPNLRTTWDKQWEPWAPIQSYFVMSTPFTGAKTHAALGPTDNVDVENIGILFLDCSANNVIIGGFIGGVLGQHINISRLCAAANDATLEHNEAHAFQKIFLHAGADETLTGEYGGWTLACNGSNWFDVSHAKHT